MTPIARSASMLPLGPRSDTQKPTPFHHLVAALALADVIVLGAMVLGVSDNGGGASFDDVALTASPPVRP